MAKAEYFDTAGDDFIFGTAAHETFYTTGGNDRLVGKRGHDTVISSNTDDFLFRGGRGNDSIEINDVNPDFDAVVTTVGGATTIEFFDGDTLMQTIKLRGVEDFEINYAV